MTKDDARVPALIHVLEAWEPPSARSEAAVRGVLELLHTSDAPFAREHDRHHLTASAIVWSKRGFLLHVHKRSGDWIQPGGHIDPGEWPADSAVREAREETGISGRHFDSGPILLGVDVHVTVDNHVHYDLGYLLLADPIDPNPPEGESQQVRWFPEADALAVADEVCKALLVTASAHLLR